MNKANDEPVDRQRKKKAFTHLNNKNNQIKRTNVSHHCDFSTKEFRAFMNHSNLTSFQDKSIPFPTLRVRICYLTTSLRILREQNILLRINGAEISCKCAKLYHKVVQARQGGKVRFL